MISSDKVYDSFEAVKRASGYTKQTILALYDTQKYLLAAYDPYTRYYATKVKPGMGDFEFTELTWEILNRLSDRTLSGSNAQMIIDAHTRCMSGKSSKLFKMILNKDLRMGLGAKSINKVFPGLIPIHDVMLAKLFDSKRLKFPCYGSPKLDGVRTKFHNGVFYSRGGHLYKGLDHLVEQLENVSDDLDGELIIPGKSFQESSGLIRNDNLTPNVAFYIFELPIIKESFTKRLLLIDDLHLIGDSVFKVIHRPLCSEDEVMQFYHGCRYCGYEGAVIKPFDYEYKGTRSYNWMKMKNVDTIDLIVTDIYEGKGKYKNMMGGVIVDFNNQFNKVGGGWSDEQRLTFWLCPSLIIGKCIEVLYMEKTNDGNMRHSRFIRFREDKNNGRNNLEKSDS